MKQFFKKLWHAEPIVAGVVGNVLFWPTVFGAASAAGHAVDPQTQKLLIDASGLLTAIAIRQTVTAPDTLKQQLADVNAANSKVGV